VLHRASGNGRRAEMLSELQMDSEEIGVRRFAPTSRAAIQKQNSI
jgi:hypothetical protein